MTVLLYRSRTYKKKSSNFITSSCLLKDTPLLSLALTPSPPPHKWGVLHQFWEAASFSGHHLQVLSTQFSSLNPLTIYLCNTSKRNAYCTLTPTEHNRYSGALKIDLTRKEPALSFNKCIYMIKYRLSVTTRFVQWYSSIFVEQVTAYWVAGIR